MVVSLNSRLESNKEEEERGGVAYRAEVAGGETGKIRDAAIARAPALGR